MNQAFTFSPRSKRQRPFPHANSTHEQFQLIPIGQMRENRMMDSDQNSPASGTSKKKHHSLLRDALKTTSKYQTAAGSSLEAETDVALNSTIDAATSSSPQHR